MCSTRYTEATKLPFHALHCASNWSSLLTVNPVTMLSSTAAVLLLHQPEASVNLLWMQGRAACVQLSLPLQAIGLVTFDPLLHALPSRAVRLPGYLVGLPSTKSLYVVSWLCWPSFRQLTS